MLEICRLDYRASSPNIEQNTGLEYGFMPLGMMQDGLVERLPIAVNSLSLLFGV